MSRIHLGAALTLFMSSLAWAQAPRETIADRISALNRGVTTSIARGVGDTNTRNALAERIDLLRQLIALDPARALQLRLPKDFAQQIREAGIPDSVEEDGEWIGALERLTEDDFERGQSRGHVLFHTSGQQIEIFLTEARTLPRGDQIRIQGMRVGDRIAVAALNPAVGMETGPTVADLTQPAVETAAALTSQDCNTLGDQKTAVILVTTPASPVFPFGFDTTFFNQRYFVGSNTSLAASSVNLFVQETSNGQASVSGQVFGPYALVQNFTCDQYSSLLSAALAAADPFADFTIYRRIAIIFPTSSCSYAGLGTIGCSRRTTSDGSNQASVSWIPILPLQNTQTIVTILSHEFGHNLGLGHAHTEDFGSITLGRLGTSGTSMEYGDPFSVMGLSRSFGGQPIGGQYPAPQKNMMLGWIGSTGYQEVQSSGSFNVVPLENSSGIRALRVLRDPATSSWLWLEFRQPIGLADSSLTLLQNTGPSTVFQGALLHYEDPIHGDDTTTHLLDTTPVAVPNQFFDAALQPGRTWSDTDSLLNITVTGASSAGVSVNVSYDTPCAVLGAAGAQFGPSGGTGLFTVTAPAGCNWSVSSAASWITLTGATSGQGTASVSYSVAPNGLTDQRSGFITFQRQSMRITQSGLGPSALSVFPFQGIGMSGQFTFHLRHSAGYQFITSADLYFENIYLPERPSCIVRYSGFLTTLRLWIDNGNTLSTTLTLANGGSSISNSQCTLFATGSSISGTGTELTITLQMGFDASYAGTHRIGADVWDNSTDSGPIALGMWTVGSACSYTLGSQSQNFSAAGGTGSVGILTASTCAWTATSDSSWLTITGGPSGFGNGSVAYSVAPFSSEGSRTGHLTIGDQIFTVQQNGCNYTFGSTGQQFSAAGGSGSVSILAPSGCSWTISGGAPWITPASAISGSSNGTFSYTVAANSGAARSAVFNIGGALYTVDQTASFTSGMPFDGTLAQIVSAGGWKMTLNYLNLGTAATQVRMDFTGNDGNALTLPFTFPQNPGTGSISTSSLVNTLNPGAQLIVESTGPDTQAVSEGWGKLSGLAGITGFGIFGHPTRKWEAAVPLETRNSSRYILAFDNASPLVTGLAVANLGTTDVNIPVVIRDVQGVTVFSGNIALSALGHTSFMLDSTYPATAGIRGTVEFQTPPQGSISVLGLRANGPSLTTLPVFADVAGGGGSLTHILYNGGFKNSFTLVNTASTPANIALNFFDNTGNALTVPLLLPQTGETVTTTSLVKTIPGNGSLLVETVGNPDVAVVEGSAQLVTAGNVGGLGIFNRLLFQQEASVPLEDRNAATYVLAFDNTNGVTTGLALTEAANQAANIGIVIRDDAGTLLLSTTLSLPPNGHTSFMLPDRFPPSANVRGTIEFVTPNGGRISAIGLRATPLGNLTTLPVLAK